MAVVGFVAELAWCAMVAQLNTAFATDVSIEIAIDHCLQDPHPGIWVKSKVDGAYHRVDPSERQQKAAAACVWYAALLARP